MIFQKLNWSLIDVIVSLTSLISLLKVHFRLFFLIRKRDLIMIDPDIIKPSDVILFGQFVVLDLCISLTSFRILRDSIQSFKTKWLQIAISICVHSFFYTRFLNVWRKLRNILLGLPAIRVIFILIWLLENRINGDGIRMSFLRSMS